MQLVERLLTFLNRRWQADVLLVHYFPAASSQPLVLKRVKHRTGQGYGKSVKSLQLHESVQIANLSQTKGSPCPALLRAGSRRGGKLSPLPPALLSTTFLGQRLCLQPHS